MRSFFALLLLSGLAVAQPLEVLYTSTRFAETPASGRGGDLNGAAATCVPVPVFGGGTVIESVVTNSPGLIYVTPGIGNQYMPNVVPPTLITDFVEIANFPQFNAIIGDLDGDGIPNESSNFPGIDALYAPFAASGRANNVHEIFVSSFSDSLGALGAIGANITEADMVLLPSAANVYPSASATPSAPVFFVRQSDWEVFFNLAPGSGNGIDLNAFTVDPLTGDLYASFDGAGIVGATVIPSAGGVPTVMTVTSGDIIRIPGAAYTPFGPYGIVTAPVSGMAELVVPIAEVNALVAAAGGVITGVTTANVYGLDIDPQPAAGVSQSTSGYFHPDLIFTVDNRGGATTGPQNASATAIYSTLGGGSYANINNVVMDGPTKAGLRDASFNPAFFAGSLDALEVVSHSQGFNPIFEKPLHLDTFPDSGYQTNFPASGKIVMYLSGSTPGAVLTILGSAAFVPAGGFVPRHSLAGLVGGFPDLYVDIFGIANSDCILAPTILAPFCQFPLIQSFFNFDPIAMSSINPVTTYVDPINSVDNGDSCFEFDISILMNVPLPANLVITFQCYDLSNNRLSTPLCLGFN